MQMNNYMTSILLFVSLSLTTSLGFCRSAEEKYGTLANGLKYNINSISDLDTGAINICYKIGSVDEKINQRGGAHFLEHMLFHSTSDYNREEYRGYITAERLADNAFTTPDLTCYQTWELKNLEQMDKIMAFEASRMKNIIMDDEVAFRNEKAAVLNELNMRSNRKKEDILLLKALDKFFIGYRPHNTMWVIGEFEKVDKLRKEDLFELYREFYEPANAAIAIASKLPVVDVQRLIEKHFSPLSNSAAPDFSQRMIRGDTSYDPKEMIVMENTEPQSCIYMMWPFDVERLKGDDYGAVNLLAPILVSLRTSVLHKSLISSNLVTEIVLFPELGYKEGGCDLLRIRPKAGASKEEINQIIAIVKDHIAKLKVMPDSELAQRIKTVATYLTSLSSTLRISSHLTVIAKAQNLIENKPVRDFTFNYKLRNMLPMLKRMLSLSFVKDPLVAVLYSKGQL